MREDVKLLTYDEIADLFGIERESARHLVLRKQWRRTKGNDGKARIEVPLDALPSPRTVDGTSDNTGDSTSPDMGDGTSPAHVLARHIERLELALETAQTQLAESEAARDAARDEARAMERDRDEARAEARVIAAQVEALNTVLTVERARAAEDRRQAGERIGVEQQRVEEWKAVADRFATQAEALTRAAETRRGWWPWRRSA